MRNLIVKILCGLLRYLYTLHDEKLRDRFKRSLSFQDGLFDRWERARRLGFADKASIYNSAAVFGDVQVGESTWIGPNVMLDGSGGPLRIGMYCSLSAGVQIYTHETVHWALSGGTAPFHQAAVAVGDFCYIGSHAIIRAGVTIGSHCVIGANAFVNKDVPSRTVVVGTPARQIGSVRIENGTIRLDYNAD